MKRFLKIFLACLMIFCSLSLIACGEDPEDDYYLQTNESFNTFITQYVENENFKDGLKYGPKITNIINMIQNVKGTSQYKQQYDYYLQLNDIYDNIFITSSKYLVTFKDVIKIKPSEYAKQDYLDFEQLILQTTQKLDKIYEKVDALDVNAGTSLQNAILDNSLQFLKEFKREYISVSSSIVDLCDKFLFICKNYIYSNVNSFVNDDYTYVESLNNDTQLQNQRNIAILDSVINTIKPAMTYLDKFNGKYVTLSFDKIFEIIGNYADLALPSTNTATIAELHLFKQCFNDFINETNNFYTSLENFDIINYFRYYNCNKQQYLERYPQDLPYITQIENFLNTDVNTLYDRVVELFL